MVGNNNAPTNRQAHFYEFKIVNFYILLKKKPFCPVEPFQIGFFFRISIFNQKFISKNADFVFLFEELAGISGFLRMPKNIPLDLSFTFVKVN
jgi:hypothetical protein